MTTADPTHRSCGHLASGPDGFPCPHPKCWASGALAVVSLADGSEELYERVLFSPASSAAFFGWRKVGESVRHDAPAAFVSSEVTRIAPPLTTVLPMPNEGLRAVASALAAHADATGERPTEWRIPRSEWAAIEASNPGHGMMELQVTMPWGCVDVLSEAADSNREHLKAHQDVQRTAKKGKKP